MTFQFKLKINITLNDKETCDLFNKFRKDYLYLYDDIVLRFLIIYQKLIII